MNFRCRVALTLVLAWICASTATGLERPISDCPRHRIILFRGVVGYWPRASAMSDRLACRGYRPDLYRSCETPLLTSSLVRDAEQGASGPIHLIGYSFGASAAVRMARNLMEHGITVDRMVLIECYDYPEIPPNVRYCVNIYESRPLDRLTPFRGTPARAADPSSTRLVDIDVSYAQGWEELRENNHFTMADDPRVQEFAARQFPDLSRRR